MSVRYCGGWLEKKYHYMSWCLSCLLLKQWYPVVELVTDEEGGRVLLDELGLPYTGVQTGLQEVERFPDDLWCLAKLYTCSIQQEPFLHVDGDCFITEPLCRDIEGKGLVAEKETVYQPVFLQLFLQYLGSNFGHPAAQGNGDLPVGKGYDHRIFGGTDIACINGFARQVLHVVDANLAFVQAGIDLQTDDTSLHYNNIHPFEYFNTLIESWFFASVAEKHGKEVALARPQVPAESYLHPTDMQKRHRNSCRLLEHRLRHMFPDQYYKLMAALKAGRI